MRATFSNKLSVVEPEGEAMIRFSHPFRIDVDVVICKAEKPARNWDLHFCSSSREAIPDTVRNGLIQEFMNYLRARGRRGIHKLDYADFLDMARAVNIV